MGRRLCAIALVTATACLGDVRTLSAQAEIWRPVGPQGAYVYALAIDPWTPTTLYAALFIDGTSGGHGVFKSTDGGSSWSPANTGLPQPHPIGSLAVDPVNPAILYAGWNYIYSGNVFKTRDGGGNWSAATGINGNGNVRTVVINPQTPATVYAGTTGEPTRSTVLKSTDSGVHWTATSHGLPSRNFSALAIDPETPDTVYAGTEGSGVFKSTDGGATWSERQLGLLIIYALAIDPRVPATIYAGTRTNGDGYPSGGVYKSTDGGASWTLTNNGLPADPSVTALTLDPQNPTTLYAAIYGVGVFKSIDGGANWTDISSGLTNPFVLALALDSQTPASLYAGTYGDGVFALTMTPPVTLTVATTGDGAGTVTSAPQGIACGADCSASYSSGATVTLTADAASSSVFTGWSGCDRVADTSCTVTMNASRSVTAGFKLPRHWGRGGGPRRHSR